MLCLMFWNQSGIQASHRRKPLLKYNPLSSKILLSHSWWYCLCVYMLYIQCLKHSFIIHLVIYMYDLLLKPRNVHVNLTGIIHCSSFLIDQFVWKISYVNIFPNWFRWKVDWMIVAFLINHIRRNTQIWKPVFASENFFTITADEFQDNNLWQWTSVNHRFAKMQK